MKVSLFIIVLKIKEDNDYIYKKNVIWLQKVKENRKHLELQSEMDIKKDNVHIKVNLVLI